MAGTLSENEETARLFAAVASTRTPEEARALLLDLCSVREIQDLSQRLEVATMLADGASYVHVSKETGASSTTVSRVSKCLNGSEGGYRLVLARLDGEKGADAAPNAATPDVPGAID